MNNKGISIIIPVYNRERFIKYAIDSILLQRYQYPFEIIIADDGSTDNSLKIAHSYNSPNIVILEKPADCRTQGAASTKNRGLKIVRYPLIAFLDSDDYQLNDFLDNMSQILLANENLDFVVCRTKEEFLFDGSSITKIWTKKKVSKYDIKYLGLTRSNIINTDCVMFRKYIFDKMTFREELKNGEDSDLWLRLGEGFRGVFANFYGVVRRSHEDGQLTKKPKKEIENIAKQIYLEAYQRSVTKNDTFRIFLFNIQQNIGIDNGNIRRKLRKLSLIIRHPIWGVKFLYLKCLDLIDSII